ncbi:MAG: UvrD-helicase domain-containing protein, partial [Prevotella sp.]|nr:UvrD-helicase domain-containing protein [Prevotella sp.]
MMKPLSVYKASAGSGKTYTLALEYIKLLIKDPYCFKKILAVTFTNKATEEMKNRILSQLYGISKGLEDSESYLLDVTQALGISKEQCKESAKKALNCLLHNYNHFRVETIDSFFQSIMRNLARELDLTANLKIDLNDEQVKDQAVDLLIEQLDSKNILLQWIISYIISNIEE